MATDLEKLVVQLSADIKGYEREMRKARGITDREARAMTDRWKKQNVEMKRIAESSASYVSTFAKGVGAGLAGAFGAQQVAKFADGSTRITNALKVAGLEGKNLTETYDRLGKIALDNGAGFEALANLYAKTTQASKELGISTRDVEEFTRRMAVGLRASGTDAGAASAGLQQLNQALASGVLRGDEFNSVAENLPVVAKAIADGIGVSLGKLREMAADGELTARRVFEAFMKGSQGLDAQAAKTSTTFSQAFENINTALTIAVGKFNETTGASQLFADAVTNVVAPAIISLGEAIENTNERHRELGADLQGFAQATGIEQGVLNVVNALKDMGREADPLVQAFQKVQEEARRARHVLGAEFSGIAGDFAAAMQSLISEGQGDVASGLSGAFIGLSEKINNGTIAATDFEKVTQRLIATNNAMADDLAGKLELIAAKYLTAKDAGETAFRAAGEALSEALGAKAIATIDALATKFSSAMPAAVGKFTEALREAVGIMANLDTQTAAVVGQLQNFSAFKLGELNTGPSAGFLNFGDLSKERAIGAAGSGAAADLIRRREGFRTKAYWDTNAYRIGFGSDSITSEAGAVSKVTAASVTSLEAANRDLARRIAEFQTTIKNGIGSDRWASFSEEQQAALTSVVYNYGELPDRIIKALKQGDPEQIGSAIRSLGDDNGGVNRGRRQQEASAFSSSGDGSLPTQQDQVSDLKDRWEGLREVTADTSGVEAQQAAYEQLGQIGLSALRGLGDALRDGKVTGEELLGILVDVVEQLINVPNLNLASLGGGGGAGGIFGNILGALFGGGGAADPWAGLRLAGGGKVRGPGGPKGDKIPAMLSDGEHVTRAAMAKKYAPLLDAINADRLPHFADGTPPRVSLPSMAGVAARGSGAAFSFSPSYQIDARGSQMTEMQMKRLLTEQGKRTAKDINQALPGMIATHRMRGARI